jgi:hypothetical protein
MASTMSFNKDDKKIEAVLQTGQIILQVGGLFFPPLAIVANDEQVFYDLYKFLSDHVQDRPGLALLSGPSLMVRNPAKW